MIAQNRNRQIGNIRLIGIGAIALVLFLIIAASIYWSDKRVVPRKHNALITAIEKRSQTRLVRLMAGNYSDRWDFSREDAAMAWKDAGTYFLVLVVSAEDPEIVFEGNTATVTTRLRLSGKALGPIGQEVMSRANQLKTPWVFTWEDQGFGTGWKLIQIENESIPDDAYGYTPGELQRLRDENF